MYDTALLDQAEKLVAYCSARRIGITTIESCTGGLLSGLLTSVPGSSAVIHSCIVTYANEAKTHYAHVDAALLQAHGAVSKDVALAMAQGGVAALQQFDAFDAHLCMSVTGIAGPGGGSADKPVGTVWIGVATDNDAQAYHHRYSGDRMAIRVQSVRDAIAYASALLAMRNDNIA